MQISEDSDDNFDFNFDNISSNSSPKQNKPSKKDFLDPFANSAPVQEPQEISQNNMKMDEYHLETIEEDPMEAESKKASKISFRQKVISESEYGIKSIKNVSVQEPNNVGLNDFESYQETVMGSGSMIDSVNHFDPNIDLIKGKKM